jgi:hypothetical protein
MATTDATDAGPPPGGGGCAAGAPADAPTGPTKPPAAPPAAPAAAPAAAKEAATVPVPPTAAAQAVDLSIAAMNGTWLCTSVEGDFDALVQAMGMGWFLRKAAKAFGYGVGKQTQVVSVEGDTITQTNVTPIGTYVAAIRMDGTPQPFDSPEGTQMVSMEADGDTIIQTTRGGEVTNVRALREDGKMTMTITCKGVTGVRVYSRQGPANAPAPSPAEPTPTAAAANPAAAADDEQDGGNMIEAVFTEEGPLGINFSWPTIASINQGTQAHSHPQLEEGMELVAVQGHAVAGRSRQDCSALFRAAGRPVKLTFRRPPRPAAATAAASPGDRAEGGGGRTARLPPRPEFTHDPALLAAAAAMMAKAVPFLREGWEEKPCRVAGVRVWRKGQAEHYGGYVPPFKSMGTVRNVPPMVMLRQIQDNSKEGEGRWKDGKTKKPLIKCLEVADWQTAAWYEHLWFMWPVTDREYTYVEKWEPCTPGDRAGSAVRMARGWHEHSTAPFHPDRVVLKAYAAMELRAVNGGRDTEWECAIEFNVGGSV